MRISLALSLALFLGMPFVGCAQDAQLNNLADKIAAHLGSDGRKIVMVMPFGSSDCGAKFGDTVYKMFRSKLGSRGSAKGFALAANRTMLPELLKEIERARQEGFDSKLATKVGKFMQADVLVTGEYMKVGDRISVTVEVVSVANGLGIYSDNENLPMIEAVKDMLGAPCGAPGAIVTAPAPAGLGAQPRERSVQMPPNPVVLKNKAVLGVVEEGIAINVEGCAQLGSSITCTLNLTATEQDVRIGWYASYSSSHTTFTDQAGRVYHAALMELANFRDDSIRHYNLVRGLPTRARIYFKGITASVTEIKVLNAAGVNEAANRAFAAQFRDVPLN